MGHVGQEDRLVVQRNLEVGVGLDELPLPVGQLLALGGDQSALTLREPVPVGDEHGEADQEGHDGVEIGLALFLQLVLVLLHPLLPAVLPLQNLEPIEVVLSVHGQVDVFTTVPLQPGHQGILELIEGPLRLRHAGPAVHESGGPIPFLGRIGGRDLEAEGIAQSEGFPGLTILDQCRTQFAIEIGSPLASLLCIQADGLPEQRDGLFVVSLLVGDVPEVFQCGHLIASQFQHELVLLL